MSDDVERGCLELWLIRHAESLGNVDGMQADTPLSPTGERQASALAHALAPWRFDTAWTSPLVRARHTLETALPGRSLDVDPRLSEYVPPPGPRVIDVSSLTPSALRALMSTPAREGGETGAAFKQRVHDWRTALPSAGRHVVVTHFAVIREIVGAQVGFRAAPQVIPHTAIFRLAIGASGETTLSRETSHLEGV